MTYIIFLRPEGIFTHDYPLKVTTHVGLKDEAKCETKHINISYFMNPASQLHNTVIFLYSQVSL